MPVRRIALLAYHASPVLEPGVGDAGGMTVYIRELAGQLALRGVRTDVFTRASGATAPVVEIQHGVRVFTIDAGPNDGLRKDGLTDYVADFVAGVRSFALSQRISYDLVHSHYWQSGLAGLRLKHAWGVPLVHSHHTLGLVKNGALARGDRPETTSRLLGERQVNAAADAVVTSTPQERDLLTRLYGARPDRLKTIQPGVDHALFDPGDRAAARRTLGVEGRAVLLYAARIQPLKGLELAVRVAEQLVHALDRELVLVVVGGASGSLGDAELARVRGLVRDLGIERYVRFEGPQPHARLPLYYRAADALVVCSHSESFGLAALEAQACGTPVVATAVGGVAHVIRDGRSGFVLEGRDAAEFATRLKLLFSDRDLHARFSRAAVAAASRFSWSSTAASFHELYDCLVEQELPEACIC